MQPVQPLWQVRRDGKALGTCTQQQLVAMARDGRLRPTDLVHTDGLARWVQAGTVRGLFAVRGENPRIGAVEGREFPSPGSPSPHALAGSGRSPETGALLGAVPLGVRVALGLFVAGSILFAAGMVWYFKQAELSAAVARCDDACSKADAWLEGASQPHDPAEIVKALTESLRQQGLPAQTTQRAKASLERIEKRKATLAAERILAAAEKAIASKRPGEAKTLLRQYIESGHAVRIPNARHLLEEIEQATSESEILAALTDLTDGDFEQAARSGDIPDGRVVQPELVATRRTTALTLVPRARQTREQRQRDLATERRQRTAVIAEQVADEAVKTVGAGLAKVRRTASVAAMGSPLLAFGEDVQEQLKMDLKQRLVGVAGDSEITDDVQRKMLAEAEQWSEDVQRRLEAEIREAARSRASRITPDPVPPGSFRRHLEAMKLKTDVASLRAWGNLEVLIARQGLTVDDIDWCEWHLANKTPVQDFSPEELGKYKRYLQLVAAGRL